MENEIIAAAASSIVAFVAVLAVTPLLIKWLEKKNMCVRDVCKPGNVMIARPGGISIIIGIIAAELVLYVFMPSNEILAVMITTSAAFVVGFIDDRRVMGGWFKPVGLAVSAVPIILLGAYDFDLVFPLFGSVHIPILYLAIIVIMIAITGNTINSIDVFNGIASGFMTIASFALTISLFVIGNYEIAIVSLPLALVSLAFYKFHKLPSRIFPGDSGALALGAMYGAIAIVGGVEVIAAIALLPAVINSFLFLSSVKRIVEHRQIKAKPVIVTDDFKLEATSEKNAAVTLVRLILADGPMTEKKIGHVIFKLAIFSGILAVISAFMMGVTV